MPNVKEANYITVQQAANILGVKRSRIYRLISQGRIKGVTTFWGKTVIPPEALENIAPGKHAYPIAVGHKAKTND